MKLSALLVTVNLVALPIAAHASGQAVSDKADWIKRNLACPEDTLKGKQRKVSLSDPGTSSKGRHNTLRPFMPNRHLPSKRELETVLLAQKAQFDTTKVLAPSVQLMAQQPLASRLEGQISAYSLPLKSANSQVCTYPQGLGYQAFNSKLAQSKKQSPPVKVPTLPEQIANAAIAASAMRTIRAEAQTKETIHDESGSPNTIPATRQGFEAVQGTMARHHFIAAPSLSTEEQAMLDELVELNYPGRFSEFQDLPGRTTPTLPLSQQASPRQYLPSTNIADSNSTNIGPPPFPLNLLPQEALQDLIGKKHRQRINAPRAYFGSWHKPLALSQLPQAGFVSHIKAGGISQGNFGNYAPRAFVSTHTSTKHRPRYAPQKMIGYNQKALCSNHVATYPSYQTLSYYGPFKGQTRLSMF